MIRFRNAVVAIGIAAATSAAVAAPADAATYYNIRNDQTRQCLSIEGGGSTSNGANAIQWLCNGGPEQAWGWSGPRLVNYKSGKCLSVAGGGSTATGAELIQWTCNGGSEQDWYFTGGHLVNGKSDKVASIANGGSYEEGTKVIQWFDNGGDEQYWFFVSAIIDA
jgi:hypothetical protein